MNSRDWRRRALRRDIATALIGLGIVALVIGLTQSRLFYSLVKEKLSTRVTKANINGSTNVYLKDGRLVAEPSSIQAPAAIVSWRASRQAIGKPGSPLWEQGAVEITAVNINDPSTNESQVRGYIDEVGLSRALPGFVGAREVSVDGKPTRMLFPAAATEVHHPERTLATFRANWLSQFRIACVGLGAIAIGSLLFPRTLICARRNLYGRCVRCNYDRLGLPACPECNLTA